MLVSSFAAPSNRRASTSAPTAAPGDSSPTFSEDFRGLQNGGSAPTQSHRGFNFFFIKFQDLPWNLPSGKLNFYGNPHDFRFRWSHPWASSVFLAEAFDQNSAEAFDPWDGTQKKQSIVHFDTTDFCILIKIYIFGSADNFFMISRSAVIFWYLCLDKIQLFERLKYL